MEWFVRDFDHPLYFEIYRDKEQDAESEGRGLSTILSLPPGSFVLDLPCGWGRLRPYLEQRRLRVIGGDLSALNLHRHQKEHPSSLVRLDLRRLPFQDQCADGVLCAYTSWGYFRTPDENQQQLQEFHRVIKAGGVLLLDLTGRGHLEAGVASVENRWIKAQEGYLERVSWSIDKRRIRTERIASGTRFRHDIWIPTNAEVRTSLEHAGFLITEAYGGLNGEPWSESAPRWIYRAIKI